MAGYNDCSAYCWGDYSGSQLSDASSVVYFISVYNAGFNHEESLFPFVKVGFLDEFSFGERAQGASLECLYYSRWRLWSLFVACRQSSSVGRGMVVAWFKTTAACSAETSGGNSS
jgi:hypothetical protein